MSLGVGLLVVGLLMAASAVLVATETSLLHIRRARAEVLTDPNGDRQRADDRPRTSSGCWTTGCAAWARCCSC